MLHLLCSVYTKKNSKGTIGYDKTFVHFSYLSIPKLHIVLPSLSMTKLCLGNLRVLNESPASEGKRGEM